MKKSAIFKTSEKLSILMFGVFMLTLISIGKAQDKSDETQLKSKRAAMEFPGDKYTPSPRESHATSPAYKFNSVNFSVVQVNVDENGNNIVDDAANEPSIAFNLNDPDKIAIGWRQFDNINNNFRQAGYAYTTDAGQTWTFPGKINPGVFRSDPVLGCDGEGNFYYNSLTSLNNEYWCNVYKSEDGGSTWEMGTFAQGGDKQWMSIDRSGGIGSGNIYEFWNGSYSVCSPYGFTRSTDGNLSYEDCSSIPNDPVWGTTFVSPEGELYVCGTAWPNDFMVARSSNAQDPGAVVEWDMTASVYLDGSIVGGGDELPNPGGLSGQTIIAMDSSGGPGHGNLYLLCSVERYSNNDPMDVMFARSTDGGLTWSDPVRVNDDFGITAFQWFGTMSVAPDGRIDAIWLDTRDNLGSVNSALYYSYSLDEGVTWTFNEKLSDSFDPHVGWPNQNKMGDYFDMYSDEEGAHLAWAATFNGEQDVYYSVITPSYVGMAEQGRGSSVSYLQNIPNPFRDNTSIRYNLLDEGFVSLKVYSTSGYEVTTLVNASQEAGMHQVEFSAKGLDNGVYFYRLQTGGSSLTKRLIILK
jgi:hypothetical protein